MVLGVVLMVTDGVAVSDNGLGRLQALVVAISHLAGYLAP